jgi:hypothetical protein
MTPSVIARHLGAEAIPKLNPKLKALNPKQIPISKFKAQNRFGHLDFGHLILFSISDLGFRIWFSEIATFPPSLRSGLRLTATTIKKGSQ